MALSVAVLVGSLRRDSLNRKMASVLMQIAPSSLALRLVEIGDLPLYNEDFDPSPPPAWVRFREQISSVSGILLVSPEYNRSVPAVLKNALDVGSRPHGQSVWNGKPCAIITVSPGFIGGFGANHHLRQSTVFLNMPILQQPEAYIGSAGSLFDSAGNITKDTTHQFLQKFMNAFADWVALHASRK